MPELGTSGSVGAAGEQSPAATRLALVAVRSEMGFLDIFRFWTTIRDASGLARVHLVIKHERWSPQVVFRCVFLT